MGSLASRPKAPKISPLPVYIPVSSPPPQSTIPSSAGGGITTPAPTPTNDDIATQLRSMGLLERTRGRISTVLTGFRGVLSQSGNAPQRKTLLGE